MYVCIYIYIYTCEVCCIASCVYVNRSASNDIVYALYIFVYIYIHYILYIYIYYKYIYIYLRICIIYMYIHMYIDT